MRTILAVSVVIAGCVTGPPDPVYWRDNHPVVARAEPAALPSFEQRIRKDLNRWSMALIEYGCPAPFYYADVPGAGEVHLVPQDQWIGATPGGWVGTGDIYIRALEDGTIGSFANDPAWTTALHEIGHAIGLGHTASCLEPTVMRSCGWPVDLEQPLPIQDVRAAACILECGPC